MKSTAADVEAWYRGGESGELLYGGEVQYFTAEPDSFERVVDYSRLESQQNQKEHTGDDHMNELGNEGEQPHIEEPVKEEEKYLEDIEQSEVSDGADPNDYEAMVERWFGGEEKELTEGFKSTHDAKDFAEKIVSGNEIKEKLDGSSQAESFTDAIGAVVNASQEVTDAPLGESFNDWFDQEYGKHPYTETRADAEDRNDK